MIVVHRRRGTEFHQRVRNIHATAATNAIRDNRVAASLRRTYNAPPEAYTGSEAPTPPPACGTKEREVWENKIGELRAQGLSYLDISVHEDVQTSSFTVQFVCRHRNFQKGEKR